MEKDKYYTPSIEEFHVGFEYEVYVPEKEIWSKEIFYLNDSHIKLIKFVNIQDENTLRRVRVKYLDRKDIESFGFDHDQTTKDGAVFYKGTLMDKNQWCLTAHKALLRFGCDYTEISIKDINGNSDYEFYGILKNKSELFSQLKRNGVI